jgi:hypothetical protein
MSNRPDFFIVGAAKAGTTAMQQILASHPAIYMSPIKEPNFFYNEVAISDLRSGLQDKLKKENAEQWIKDGMHGEIWNAFLRDELLYKKLFEKASTSQICGEASVSYLYSLEVAKNIFNYNPESKIIILLRNPAERAWSHFMMEKRMGLVPKSFSVAFDLYKNDNHKIWGKDPIFLSGGMYYAQVKRYLDVFPKEQVYICFYENYKANPVKTIKQILEFLGVTESNDIKIKVANEARKSIFDNYLPSGGLKHTLRTLTQRLGLHAILKKLLSKKSDEKLPTDLRKQLSNYYLDDIIKLEQLLNVNLNNWK